MSSISVAVVFILCAMQLVIAQTCTDLSYVSIILTSNDCEQASMLLYDTPRSRLVLACDTGAVQLQLPENNATVLTDSRCPQAQGIDVDPVSGATLAACEKEGAEISFHSTWRTLLTGSQCNGGGQSVFQDRVFNVQYVSCATEGVKLVNGTSISVIVPYEIVGETNFVYRDPLNGRLYVGAGNGLYMQQDSQLSVIANSSLCAGVTRIIQDPISRMLYAVCGKQSSIISVHDTDVKVVMTGDQCRKAQAVWHNERLGIFVAACANGIIVLHERSGAVSTLVTPSICHGVDVAATDDFDIAYAACDQTSRASAISISGITISSLADTQECTRAVFDQISQGVAWMSCGGNGLVFLNGNSVRTVITGSDCFAVSVIRASWGSMIVACGNGNMQGIIAVDPASGNITQLANSTTCGSATDVFENESNGIIYATCEANGVVQIQRSSSTPANETSSFSVSTVLNITLCASAHAVVADRNSGFIYTDCSAPGIEGLILAIDPHDFSVTQISTCVYRVLHADAADGRVFGVCGAKTSTYILSVAGNSGDVMQGIPFVRPVSLFHDTSGVVPVFLIGTFEDGLIQVSTTDESQSTIFTGDNCGAANQVFKDSITGIIYSVCSYNSLRTISTSFRCVQGTFYNLGSCVVCPAHTYRSLEDLAPFSPCLPCQPGFVSNQGSAACSPCGPGTFEENNQCLLCATGKYQMNHNATTCVDCPAGSYAIRPGSSECVPCDTGFYSTINGSVSCLPCDSGRASNVRGLTHPCDGCPAGTYQASIGQTECLPCPNHFYSEQANSTSCTRCANQVNEDRTACNVVTCDANSQFNENTNQCELCPLSQYSSKGGLCSTCVVSTYTPAAGSGCAGCDEIEGLTCSGGIAFVKQDYWAYLSDDVTWTNPSDPTKHYPRFLAVPCPLGFCPSTALQPLNNTNAINSTNNNEGAQGIQYCNYPRLNSANNTFCAQCEESYLAWGDSCVHCSGANGGLFFAYIVFSFALVLFLFHTSASTSSAASTSIFLFFIQTAALEMGPVVPFIDWIQLFNLNTKSTSTCLAPWNAYQQSLFSILIPVILMVELGIMALIHFLLHRCVVSDPEAGARNCNGERGSKLLQYLRNRLQQFSWNDYRLCIVAILLFCYTQVATTSLRYLHCVEVGPQRLNFSAPTMDCRSSDYHAYLIPVLIAMIVYVVGFPAIAFTVLWRNKASLFLSADSDEIKSNPSLASFIHHWSPFYSMYHPRAFYWQCWVLVRRSVLVVPAVFLMHQTIGRFVAFTFIHLVSLLLHQAAAPYEAMNLNRIETASYTLLMCISLILTAFDHPYSVATQVLLFLVIVPPALTLLSWMLVQRWKKFVEQVRAWTTNKRSESDHNDNEFEVQSTKYTELRETLLRSE